MAKVDISGVTKNYGDNRVLKGASLKEEFENGGIIGVVGANGAGKSTLFKILAFLDQPQKGTFELHANSHQITDKSQIGYLPEERSLPALGRVYDVLFLWCRLRGISLGKQRETVDKWLEKVGLYDRKDSKVKELSKGNQQKLQLACALIHTPSFVLFDEPFSGLDPSNQELVIRLLVEFRAQGALILLSAHQLELIERICDVAYLLKGGLLENTAQLSGNSNRNIYEFILTNRSKEVEKSLLMKRNVNGNYEVDLEDLSVEMKAQLFDRLAKGEIKPMGTPSLRELYLNNA